IGRFHWRCDSSKSKDVQGEKNDETLTSRVPEARRNLSKKFLVNKRTCAQPGVLTLPILSIFLLAWIGWNADIEGRGLGELCTYDKMFDTAYWLASIWRIEGLSALTEGVVFIEYGKGSIRRIEKFNMAYWDDLVWAPRIKYSRIFFSNLGYGVLGFWIRRIEILVKLGLDTLYLHVGYGVLVFSLLGGIRGDIGINTFRNALMAHYLPHSSMYVSPPSITIVRPWFETIGYSGEIGAKGTLKRSYLPPRWRLLMAQVIQCFDGKIRGLDQISNKDATIMYCLANRVKVDYARLIWEDIIHKLSKKTREKVVPYPRYGYCKNQKKTVKSRKTRTRERIECTRARSF
ncbi:hypothetical protein Tco_1035485, partial [Tanacetum coccineum]